jgi:hypothetical protein
MTVNEIMTRWLLDHGYDGLTDGDCGCEVSDLANCEDPFGHCEPGYKVKCDCPDGCTFHIVTRKDNG